jgi:hypothetical protein
VRLKRPLWAEASRGRSKRRLSEVEVVRGKVWVRAALPNTGSIGHSTYGRTLARPTKGAADATAAAFWA